MRRIIIDSGHGGIDNGASAEIFGRRVYEKDLNYVMATLVTNMLSGIPINDIWLNPEHISNPTPLKHRLDFVNKEDVFISIHHNSYRTSQPNGFEIFHGSIGNHAEQSKILAQYVHSQIKNAFPERKSRGVKVNNRLFLIKNSPCVTILIECGFMSNYHELTRMILPHNLIKMAESIAQGVMYWCEA